jgi:hypothetical protein
MPTAAALLLGSIASASATEVGDELESFDPPVPVWNRGDSAFNYFAVPRPPQLNALSP